jgi:hypothetical protein
VKTTRSDSYRLSERVLITRGTKFRASGGPYWKTKSGEKISLSSRGPYTFHAHVKRGSVEWIECLDKDGAFAVLHLAGRRKRIDGSLVPRPYKITGRKLDKRSGRQ